jgi:hypothetical protein
MRRRRVGAIRGLPVGSKVGSRGVFVHREVTETKEVSSFTGRSRRSRSLLHSEITEIKEVFRGLLVRREVTETKEVFHSQRDHADQGAFLTGRSQRSRRSSGSSVHREIIEIKEVFLFTRGSTSYVFPADKEIPPIELPGNLLISL